MFFPLHAAPVALSGKSSTTSSTVYLSTLNSGSKSTQSDGGIVVASHQTGLDGHYAGLPGWAWLIVGIAGGIVLLFVGAFAYFAVDERRKSRAQVRPFRIGRALWKAVKIALFLWVFIGLAKLVTGGRKRRSGVSSYQQVNAEKTEGLDKARMAGGVSTVSITGGPTYQAYGESGSGRRTPSPRAAAEMPATTIPSITGGSYCAYSDGGSPPRTLSPLPAAGKYEPYRGAPHRASPNRPAASTEYQSTTAVPSSMPLMADPYLGGSSRPSTRDPSPAPSATYVPGQGSHGVYRSIMEQ